MSTNFKDRDWWALWKKTSKKWNEYYGGKLTLMWKEFRIMCFEIDENWYPEEILVWKDWENLKDFDKIKSNWMEKTKNWSEYKYFEHDFDEVMYHVLRMFKNERYVEWWKAPIIQILVSSDWDLETFRNKWKSEKKKQQEDLFNDISDELEKEEIQDKEKILTEEEDLNEIF